MYDAIDAIRIFNRFFTRHVGAIDTRFLGTDLNLAEARLLFEIAGREPVLAHDLQDVLGLDRGYLSRMLTRFEARGWVKRDRLDTDARARPIGLTPIGRSTFDHIEQRQRAVVADDLNRLSPMEQDDLVQALTKARLLLDRDSEPAFTLRDARPGDVSQVAARQSALYADSHGWGHALETHVAQAVSAFLSHFKPGRDRCWIADMGGAMAGAIFVTDEGEGVARLRLLHVEPFARRRGIGDALVTQCVAFARSAGYEQIFLHTHSVLEPARRLYARHGFECISTDIHHDFGKPVQGETWRKNL